MEILASVEEARHAAPQFRRFVLERRFDVSGVSGSGIVAGGVVFPSGKCITQWRATADIPVGSTVFYESLEQIVAIHGHGGETVVRFLDSFFQVLDAGGFDVLDELLTPREIAPAG